MIHLDLISYVIITHVTFVVILPQSPQGMEVFVYAAFIVTINAVY